VGQTLYLEPLNRYEDHLINTVARARQYIEQGQFAHVRILADVYHMNIEEANTQQAMRENRALIRHVHFADNHRYEPGSGQLDFRAVLETLHEIEYQGRICFECRVLGPDPAAAYRTAAAHIRGLLRETWAAS